MLYYLHYRHNLCCSAYSFTIWFETMPSLIPRSIVSEMWFIRVQIICISDNMDLLNLLMPPFWSFCKAFLQITLDHHVEPWYVTSIINISKCVLPFYIAYVPAWDINNPSVQIKRIIAITIMFLLYIWTVKTF